MPIECVVDALLHVVIALMHTLLDFLLRLAAPGRVQRSTDTRVWGSPARRPPQPEGVRSWGDNGGAR